MTLKTLSLQNFKRYASFEMTFEEGLCGILGRNGSGKSTIYEAVFFALYGEYKNKELLKRAYKLNSLIDAPQEFIKTKN